MPSAAHAWVLAALDLVFPALCPVCDLPLGVGRRDPLCGACWDGIERIRPPLCTICGVPFPTLDPAEAGPPGPCPACARLVPPFDYARAAGVYGGPLREAIQAFKFGARRPLARPLSDLVLEQCGDLLGPDVDALVPVPLAAARERERGFNQAGLVAHRLARASGRPLRAAWLRRVRPTRPQTDLGAAERQANVRGAFGAAPAVAGRHVLVVDDVFTTGATVAECAHALRARGAWRVGVLTVARVVQGAV